MYNQYNNVPTANVPLTEKQKRMLLAYKASDDAEDTVYEVYKKPSETKVRIEEQIKRKMDDIGGWRYRIVSGNCQHFTCAYLYKEFIGGFGKIHLVYITYKNVYDFVFYTDDIEKYTEAQKHIKELEEV